MRPHERIEETSISLSTAAPAPPERRRGQRHLTILRVAALIVEGERELCLVRNISAGGVMAHVYRRLAVGTRVSVEIKNDEPIPGSVAWEEDSNVGIAFDVPIDVPDLLATSKELGGGRRARRPRIEVEDRLAKVRCGADIHWVQVRDVSQGGICADVDARLPINADVVVTLEDFRPLPGVVRWQRENRVGIGFIQVIPIAELCEWLRRQG